MSEPTGPTVETPAAVTFNQVYDHIHTDYYIHRRASYDIRAIVAKLAQEHPGAELADINQDTLWAILEAHITCLHSPWAGMCSVDLEDVLPIAEDGAQKVECYGCDRVFSGTAKRWIKL